MDAIEIQGLVKRYGTLLAVDHIDMRVARGELFGLLGPNGAGKTTIVSILSTILKPTSGIVRVWGNDVMNEQDKVREKVGIVFQDPSLDEELTAYENLDFHGRLYGIPKEERKRRAVELLRFVELENFSNKYVKTFSGGMRRRLEIARGFLHKPKILFLDEPTLGLDPQTRRHIWGYIKNLNTHDDITVILTTHYMEEADYLCDRIAIMDNGKVIATDSPAGLKGRLMGDLLNISVSDSQRLLDVIGANSWLKSSTILNGNLLITVDEADKRLPSIIKMAHASHMEIESINIRRPTLEDVFIHLTGKVMRDESGGVLDHIRSVMRAGQR
ncbi:MAG: ATP-binding cassette domain-containing protein [Thermodesulfobacteriota bacterium]|nr:ATP-binding cassette domain-containing protein [Thermodesulfobacteriota bacterium]